MRMPYYHCFKELIVCAYAFNSAYRCPFAMDAATGTMTVFTSLEGVYPAV